MRILYDHQAFSLQSTGGISRYYHELLRHLAELDSCKPEIAIGIQRNGFDFRGLPGVKTWSFHGFRSLASGKTRYILNELLSTALFSCCGEFDVYHPTLYGHVRTARWKKMVITHHDCAYERYPALFNRVEMIKHLRARQFQMADAIICPSESTRRDLHEFYDVPASKTFVVHHGVTRMQRDPNRRSEFVCERPFLLYVGSRASYKNFPALLNGFAAAGLKSEFNIVVVGGGETTDVELALIVETGLAERVQFVPRVSDALLAEIYTQARLLVCPSLYEGFGLPPLEAMSFACPVLAANNSSLPEICGDAAFYFQTGDLDSFVSSLQIACFDESQRATKKENGKRLVTSYSWQKCAASTLAIYKQ
jgi:glycosyltransferase involved in cell wall biosynthesis